MAVHLLIGVPTDWAHDSHMQRGIIHWCIQSRYQDTRGVESWWGYSDSESGLLNDYNSSSDSNSGSDKKYKITNTLIVKHVLAKQKSCRKVGNKIFQMGKKCPKNIFIS